MLSSEYMQEIFSMKIAVASVGDLWVAGKTHACFSILFCYLLIFSNQLLENSFRNTISVNTVWIQIRSQLLLGLIWDRTDRL